MAIDQRSRTTRTVARYSGTQKTSGWHGMTIDDFFWKNWKNSERHYGILWRIKEWQMMHVVYMIWYWYWGNVELMWVDGLKYHVLGIYHRFDDPDELHGRRGGGSSLLGACKKLNLYIERPKPLKYSQRTWKRVAKEDVTNSHMFSPYCFGIFGVHVKFTRCSMV